MADIAGLKLIVPTSVTGGTVSATGKVSFTNATTISVNGCFNATYDNYQIVFRWKPASNEGFNVRLRASGADNQTASSYVSQRVDASGGTVGGNRLVNSYWFNTYSEASLPAGNTLYVYGPALTQPTAIRGVSVATVSGASIEDYAGTHNQSIAYDGITLYSNAALTGALTIYGLVQA